MLFLEIDLLDFGNIDKIKLSSNKDKAEESGL